MKVGIVTLGALLLLFPFSGCSREKSNASGDGKKGDGAQTSTAIAGKYIDEKEPDRRYVELKPDGTFTSKSIWDSGRGAGDYKIEGNRITLKNNVGDSPITGTIEGNTLLFGEKLRLTKK
jgi:hypothetical protein